MGTGWDKLNKDHVKKTDHGAWRIAHYALRVYLYNIFPFVKKYNIYHFWGTPTSFPGPYNTRTPYYMYQLKFRYIARWKGSLKMY